MVPKKYDDDGFFGQFGSTGFFGFLNVGNFKPPFLPDFDLPFFDLPCLCFDLCFLLCFLSIDILREFSLSLPLRERDRDLDREYQYNMRLSTCLDCSVAHIISITANCRPPSTFILIYQCIVSMDMPSLYLEVLNPIDHI